MMSREKIRYNLDNIDKKGALINLIWGERSNGKSYQVKHKKAIENYLHDTKSYFSSYKNISEVVEKNIKSGNRFILMRRWKEEISTEKIEQYFDDVDVYKLTDKKYNCITMYKKQLYLSNYISETGKSQRGEKIGYVVALSTEQNYAGASYLDVTDIIFEEFMSRSVYITHESDKLMNFYSTVDRKRGSTRLWLVGNTISRVCPYLEDWGLQKIIKQQKQGTIETLWLSTGTYDDDNKEIKIKLAIEYCMSTGQSSFVIGKRKDMANKGSWQTDPQPHLPKSYKEYKKLYSIGFQYQSFKFICDFLQDKQTYDCIWFIKPFNSNFPKNKIVFSDVIKTSNYWQRDIYNPTFKNKKLCDILKTFKEHRIFYASDLCGTDFKQVIDFEIRK